MNKVLPVWAKDLADCYQSDAANQFILHGNVGDRMLIGAESRLGDITDFLKENLLGTFDVVLTYDIGNGLRVEKGRDVFATWPHFHSIADTMPRSPGAAVEVLTRYFRYAAALAVTNPERKPVKVGFIMHGADMVVPSSEGGVSHDTNATASLMRGWSSEPDLVGSHLATFILADAINDLHPLLASNTRAASFKLPLPTSDEILALLDCEAGKSSHVFGEYITKMPTLAAALSGLSLAAIHSLVKVKNYRREPIAAKDLSKIKKELVEKECGGLITFVESGRTFNDLHGLDGVKAWVLQDIALWQAGDIVSMPMGYLICGPVGTGKTFLVECIAGEANVPVVIINNFRDKWLGTTEGNLEKIFRLLAALGKCYVFVDEADQALGKRDSGSDDGGLSGRIYSMFAKEMSNTANRGKILWILASSRPDLIEVDLKRPGRVDVKIPIFPTTSAKEGFDLLRAISERRGVSFKAKEFTSLKSLIPPLLTPGAADALAGVIRRATKAKGAPAIGTVLKAILTNYQAPVAANIMQFQIGLAASEATDLAFVPEMFRAKEA